MSKSVFLILCLIIVTFRDSQCDGVIEAIHQTAEAVQQTVETVHQTVETVHQTVAKVPLFLMESVKLMSKYLGFLNRCPLEIVQFISYMQFSRSIQAGDICSLNSYRKNSPLPFVYFECVPNTQRVITFDMAEFFGITNMLRQVMAQKGDILSYADEIANLTGFVMQYTERLSGALTLNFSLDSPEMSQCGVYARRYCSNGNERFNYFSQKCEQDNTLALNFQMYLTMAKGNKLLQLPIAFVPNCVADKIPDAIQFLIITMKNKTKDVKEILLNAADTHKGRIDPLRLLHSWAIEYTNDLQLTENTDSERTSTYGFFYFLSSLKNYGLDIVKYYVSKLLIYGEPLCGRRTPESIFEDILKINSKVALDANSAIDATNHTNPVIEFD